MDIWACVCAWVFKVSFPLLRGNASQTSFWRECEAVRRGISLSHMITQFLSRACSRQVNGCATFEYRTGRLHKRTFRWPSDIVLPFLNDGFYSREYSVNVLVSIHWLMLFNNRFGEMLWLFFCPNAVAFVRILIHLRFIFSLSNLVT